MHGKPQYETVEAVGVGQRADHALSKALVNAVSQVNGAVAEQHMDIRESADRVVWGWYGTKIEIPAQSVNVGATQTFSSGHVRRYKVLSTERDEKSGHYRVRIQATVQAIGDYANLGEDRSALTPIAVLPLDTKRGPYPGLTGLQSAGELSDRLSSGLSDALVNTNRFRVMDRQKLPATVVEKVITRSMGSKTGQQVKFDQTLSADLLVVGTVEAFSITSRPMDSYGSSFDQYEAEMVLDLRVIEMATQEVRYAQRFEQYLDHDQINDQLKAFGQSIFKTNNDRDKRRTQRMIEDHLIQGAANAIASAFYADYVPADNPGLPEGQLDERGIEIGLHQASQLRPGQPVAGPAL